MDAENIIRAELDADPLGRGYAGMSAAEAAVDLELPVRDLWVRVAASDILEAIVPAAFNGLEESERRDVDSVLSLGSEVDASPGSKARTILTTAFAGSQPTLNAIQNLGKQLVSRASEIGCSRATEYLVSVARSLEP